MYVTWNNMKVRIHKQKWSLYLFLVLAKRQNYEKNIPNNAGHSVVHAEGGKWLNQSLFGDVSDGEYLWTFTVLRVYSVFHKFEIQIGAEAEKGGMKHNILLMQILFSRNKQIVFRKRLSI